VANQKEIRKRIASVKSTQKITRAMKMVAGARLNRAQQRIVAIRPYATKTGEVLAEVTAAARDRMAESSTEADHPLLVRREEQRILLVVVTSDRGLCGAFNTNITRRAHQLWNEAEAAGKQVSMALIGRKSRDYFRRRSAPIREIFEGVWETLDLEQARRIARGVLAPYVAGEVDAIYLVYNEFKSAMTQQVIKEALFPLDAGMEGRSLSPTDEARRQAASEREFIFEPSKEQVLERLVPMYVEVSVLRALLESQASELGARMTAMDSATKNASEMIEKLTLQYNRARQSAITTELMEIIGGAEALQQ
jgi:F-type H+-transporting ATPase subunit gamma